MFLKFYIPAVFFACVLPMLGCATEEESSDALYARALSLRNEKTTGSVLQAESIFLKLAHLEHSKTKQAQHNYAMIQYQNKKYEIAYDYFTRAGLEQSKKNCDEMLKTGFIKQDLYLVVGSDRESGIPSTGVFRTMYGLDIDMSHINAFDGNATTMDLRPSYIIGAKHLVGNAQAFDFAKRYNIKHVLLERLPTSPDASIASGEAFHEASHHLANNVLGACVEQISKAMRSGAILEVEWDPYLTLWGVDQATNQNFIQKNPFQGFMDLNVALQSVVLLHGDVNPLPEDMRIQASALSEKVREKLEFYHQQGASDTYEQLLTKVYWEVRTIQNMYANNSMVHLICDLQNDSIDIFIKEAKSAIFENFPKRSVGKQVKVVVEGEPERIGVVYDMPAFLQGSVLNLILGNIAAENNSPYVKTYLESIGFSHVSIARGTNIHNGRKNVMMIHAIKI